MANFYRRLLLIVVGISFSSVAAVAAQAGTQTFTGNISNSQESRFYEFQLTQGQAILAVVEATSGTLDTYLILRDPAGNTVAENDDLDLGVITDSALGAVAAQTGTYELEVTRYPEGDSSGNYSLEVTIGAPNILDRLSELIVRVTLSGSEQVVDTPHFRIHYTTSGADAATAEYVRKVAQAVEDFYNIEINQLGWAVPPSDQALGGNDRYDVYITDVIGEGEGALGYTSPETIVGDNPNTSGVEVAAATSYLVIDNDYANTDTSDPTGLMRTTFAHEFNHAIQFGYDGNETHNWMYESTATWMETAAAGKDQDATGYVEYAYQYPEICFGTTSDPGDGQLQYGDWTFIQMLSDLFGEEIVPTYWEYVAEYQGWESLERMLADRGMTLPETLAAYRLKNLARDYELAPLFNATVWLENTIDETGTWTFTGEGIQELGANYYRFNMPTGVYFAGVAGNSNRLQVWAVGVLGNEKLEAIPLDRGGFFDTTSYREVYLMVFNAEYKEDVESCNYASYNLVIEEAVGIPATPRYIFPALHFQTLR